MSAPEPPGSKLPIQFYEAVRLLESIGHADNLYELYLLSILFNCTEALFLNVELDGFEFTLLGDGGDLGDSE